MILALVFMAMIGWGCWSWLRDPSSPRAVTSVTSSVRPVTGTRAVVGLEDDPDRWGATGPAWTSLDELQLTRLLVNSMPLRRRVMNTVDDAIPQQEQKDTT